MVIAWCRNGRVRCDACPKSQRVTHHPLSLGRYVACASTEDEQNLTVFQYRGYIYYRVCQTIPANTELLVWIGEEYARTLGLRLGRQKHGEGTGSVFPVSEPPFFLPLSLWAFSQHALEQGRSDNQVAGGFFPPCSWGVGTGPVPQPTECRSFPRIHPACLDCGCVT